MNTIRNLALAIFAALIIPCTCLAADASTEASPPTNWVLLLIPVVVPIIIAGIKLVVPQLSPWKLPLLAPILGALADYLASGNLGATTVAGAIAGSAGVGLREVVDQIKKRSQQPTP